MQLRWMGLLTLGACLSASHGTTQTEGDAPVSMRTTSHVESPVTLLSTDVEWMVWADVQNPPPLWPLLELPTETRKLHSLLPEDWKATSDLVVDLGSDPEDLRTSGLWWSGALAPFIGRTPEHYAEEAPRMQAANRRRLRSGRPEFSRTTLVYPVPQGPPVEVNEETHADPVEGGIRTMYFAKSIDVEDPSAFVALQAEIKLANGGVVYLNGQEIARYNVLPGLELHDLSASLHSLPAHVTDISEYLNRWQPTVMGISPALLRKGRNVVSAEVHKRREGGNPAFVFDLHLEAYARSGFTKTPYLQNLDLDGVTVMWETNQRSVGEVEVRAVEGSQGFTVPSMRPGGALHEARLTGLKVDTEYEYRVRSHPVRLHPGEGQVASVETEWARFRTAVAADQPYVFLAYGDNRSAPEIHARLVERMRGDVERSNARFLVQTGDLVISGWKWHAWQKEFFEPSLPLMRELTYYTALGNHEGNHLAYYQYFDLPGNESWYSFSQGSVDFFAVNSSADFGEGSEQYAWLTRALKESTSRWKVAFFHHPPYSCTPNRKPGDLNVQKWLVPLFEAHGVQLVLLGHDHLYGRSPDLDGVRYVITGGGGAPKYRAEPDAFNEVCESVHHYLRVSVEASKLTVTAIDIDGREVDKVEIPHGP